MFGNNNQDQNYDDTASAQPTIVTQSNMAIDDNQTAPALGRVSEESIAPSNFSLTSAADMPAPALPLPVPAMPVPVQPPAIIPLPEAKAESPKASGLPTLSLANAYIPSDPPAVASKHPDDNTKPSASSLLINPSDDELIQMKQEALRSLEPLVDKLEQTPEEKFRTTMMLIQASDNPDLIKDAYEAANKIKDEKVRAQALLDVVNEINYFTHHLGQAENPA